MPFRESRYTSRSYSRSISRSRYFNNHLIIILQSEIVIDLVMINTIKSLLHVNITLHARLMNLKFLVVLIELNLVIANAPPVTIILF